MPTVDARRRHMCARRSAMPVVLSSMPTGSARTRTSFGTHAALLGVNPRRLRWIRR